MWTCKKSWTREHDRKFTCDWTCVNYLRNNLKTLKSTHSQIKLYLLMNLRIETLTKMETKRQTMLKYLSSSQWNTNFSLRYPFGCKFFLPFLLFFCENMKCFSGRKTANYFLRVQAEVEKVKAINKYCTRPNLPACLHIFIWFLQGILNLHFLDDTSIFHHQLKRLLWLMLKRFSKKRNSVNFICILRSFDLKSVSI